MKGISKLSFYVSAFTACSIMAITSGCASGGYKLTRKYSGFVNKQNIILRVVLYLLTGIVFAVTLLIDMVVYNTMDFWEGRVSQGTYQFEKGDKSFVVQHEILPSTELKRSTIEVFGSNKELLQEVVLSETASGEVELYVDGALRSKVKDISSIPVASIYDAQGSLIGEEVIGLGKVSKPLFKIAASN